MPFFKDKAFTSTLAQDSSSAGVFINPSKLDPDGGSIRFAILSDEPITGYELWFEKAEGGMTPRRVPAAPDSELIEELAAEVGGRLCLREGKPQISQFAAFFVYDYDADAVRVFSATQKTILRELDRLTSDPDFEELSQWDCQVSRKGKGTDTKYSVDMKPSRAKGSLGARVEAAWKEAKANGADLEALFTGGNPLPAAG